MVQNIRQDMRVVGSDGQSIGIVRGIDGDHLLLVGEDSARIPLGAVEEVAQDVSLRLTARDAIAQWLSADADAVATPRYGVAHEL